MTNMLDTPRKEKKTEDLVEQRQLKALKEPIRLRLFNALGTPRTVTEAAKIMGVERKSLYYHLKILMNARLIEERENHRVRNLTETVYVAKNIAFNCNDLLDPSRYEQLCALKKDFIGDLCDDCTTALKRDRITKMGMCRSGIKIKNKNLEATTRLIGELMREFNDKVLELADEDGDIEYILAVVHFESGNENDEII